jgi:DNA-binding transcriptional ArsR family regulator
MNEVQGLEVLDALSNESRLRVFRLLVKAGPQGLPAGDIAKALAARQNTMSTHLKQLTQAGLIANRRAGRSIIYKANFATLQSLVMFLLRDCCALSPEICRPVAASLAESGQLSKRCKQ